MSEADAQRDAARAAREALIGRSIAGRYVLRRLVGHGGMGAVYEAEHVGLGKRVAVKFIDPEFATEEQVVARFAREARAMSTIESAHIVTVFDAGTEDGRPYLVMELLRGEDLGQWLRRTRRVPLDDALHIVAQVLKGLARAHAKGVIHRDLKPDNVFVVRGDTDPLFAKIVDFGVSKIERPRAGTAPLALTGRGTVLGTPFYMSPEQAQAASDVDARADLYSVGAILFECLTGRPPHTGESYEQVILSICMREAPDVRAIDPNVPSEVCAFVARALSRDREQRFSSAERMLAALHEIAPQEKERVPLDPTPAETMLSAGAPAPLSANSEAAKTIETPPAFGVATRLAGSGPAEESAEAVGPGSLGGVRASGNHSVSGAAAEERASARGSAPAATTSSAGPGSSSPKPRRMGPIVATAALATLLGVGATFGLITALDKPAPGAPTPTRRAATASAATETATITSAVASGAQEPAPSASASASASAEAEPTPKTPATARTTPRASGAPAAPKPSAKPLDIQRDLP